MCLQAVESHLRPVLQTLAHEVDPNSKVDVAHFLAGKQTRCTNHQLRAEGTTERPA